MPSKAFRTSEWDLNTNLSIKISAIDFSIGFINTDFIQITKTNNIYKPFP